MQSESNIILDNINSFNKIFSNTEIKNRIEKLNEDEMCEIYKIIKNNNEKHTINKNGIFINLSSLRSETLKQISYFLYFFDVNNKLIDEDEKNRDIYKQYIN